MVVILVVVQGSMILLYDFAIKLLISSATNCGSQFSGGYKGSCNASAETPSDVYIFIYLFCFFMIRHVGYMTNS